MASNQNSSTSTGTPDNVWGLTVVQTPTEIEPRYMYVGSLARRNRTTYPYMYVNSVCNDINFLKPSYIMVTFFKNALERIQYMEEIEKIKKEMCFFLVTEDTVEMKDSCVLSYEDLLLVLDFVWFPLVKTFIINWGISMVPHIMRWNLDDVQRRFQLPQYEWPDNEDPEDDVIDEIRRYHDDVGLI